MLQNDILKLGSLDICKHKEHAFLWTCSFDEVISSTELCLYTNSWKTPVSWIWKKVKKKTW